MEPTVIIIIINRRSGTHNIVIYYGSVLRRVTVLKQLSARCCCALNPGFLHAAVSSPVLSFSLSALPGLRPVSGPNRGEAAGASSVAQGGTGGSPERLGPLSKSTAASPGLAVHFSRHWPLPSPHQPGQRPEYRNLRIAKRTELPYTPLEWLTCAAPCLPLLPCPPDLTGTDLMVGGWQQWEVCRFPRQHPSCRSHSSRL